MNALHRLLVEQEIWKEEENGKTNYGTNSTYSLGPDLANLSDEEFYKKLDESGDAPGSIPYEILKYFHIYEKVLNDKNISDEELKILIKSIPKEEYEKIINDVPKASDTKSGF